jgi:putative transposase
LGTRKLHYLLHCQPQLELQVGRDRLFSILRERRLLVARKRAYHKTTDSHHRFRRHPNLLKAGPDQVVASGPEQVWVADITYLPTQEGVAYLSLVTDAFSRKIVGYHVHESLNTESVAHALRRAVKHRRTEQPLVHHSDRGSRQFRQRLWRYRMRQSISRRGNCWDHAPMERVFRSLKTEWIPTVGYMTAQEAHRDISHYLTHRMTGAPEIDFSSINRL